MRSSTTCLKTPHNTKLKLIRKDEKLNHLIYILILLSRVSSNFPLIGDAQKVSYLIEMDGK
jgi:hypothetical protein